MDVVPQALECLSERLMPLAPSIIIHHRMFRLGEEQPALDEQADEVRENGNDHQAEAKNTADSHRRQ